MLPLFLILAAHDLDIATRTVPPVAIMKATYAGTDPVPFAKVQVFSPAGAEFQNANTDKNGSFSFVPDAPGTWRVIIDDELGHRRETAVVIASVADTGPSPAQGASRGERALLGVSLLLAAAGFWYGYQSRPKK